MIYLSISVLSLCLIVAIAAILSAAATIFILRKSYLLREKILKTHVERKIYEIERKNKELEKNNLIKTRLISIISHDIITPLRFMHMTGKRLVDKQDSFDKHDQFEIMKEIIDTSGELEMLSTNILNWIKYYNKNRKLYKEPLNLHSLVSEVFSILRPAAKEKGVKLSNDIPELFITTQYFEPLKIIIYNLVVNAINFMEKGHITISGKEIRTGLLIIVEDQGFGMTQQQIDNILSEQIVVSAANTKGKRGNGLGYLIIKDLLNVTNGSLSIKSKKGKGTKIKLFFQKESEY